MSGDIGRRGFLQLTGGSALSALSTDTLDQLDDNHPTDYEFDEFATLIGPKSARPDPGDEFFEQYERYRFVYKTFAGAESQLTQNDDAWKPLNYIQQQPVFSSDDLPDPSGGVHPLEDNTAYVFNGFVTSPYGLELGNSSPLIGRHGSLDGFIHTGGATAVTGTDAGFFARDMYFHAPGGTMFDLTATNTTEMLVESCAFSDAAGIAPIASLGTIDGYRVPTFKGCNFEDFGGGLTFDGDPDKIFVWGSPLRTVTASNVSIFTIASTCNVQIVDFADNYVKDVQSDTEIWRVETGASPSEVFQYRGTTHDTSFNKGNALTGEGDPQVEPYWVSDSYPVRDSAVVGELSMTEAAEGTDTTFGSQDTYVRVEGATTLGNETQRVSMPSDGVLQYDGSRDVNTHITGSLTVAAPANETFAVALGKNGTVEPTSEVRGEGSGNAPVAVTFTAVEDLTPTETVSVFIKNIDSTSSISINAYNFAFLG